MRNAMSSVAFSLPYEGMVRVGSVTKIFKTILSAEGIVLNIFVVSS